MARPKPSTRARVSDFFFGRPSLRRVAWHARRFSAVMDRRLLARVVVAVVIITMGLAILANVVEGRPLTMESLSASVNWAVHALFGKGDPAYLTTLAGFVISWTVVLIGAALVGMITAGLVAVLIDFLLKEGQGMGAAGFKDHIVACGWNATARDLVDELRSDDYKMRVVVLSPGERNPAGAGVYFVKGEPTKAGDLERSGIAEASAAIIFPADDSNEADLRSILTVMAIESIAPDVRTIAAVNDPGMVEHFHRAGVDEVLITSRLASRLLARAALYPGLTGLVTDIVSGGKGSELYRISPPPDYYGLSVDELSRLLQADHHAKLMAIIRDGETIVNPPTDFYLRRTDEVVVVAEALGRLLPSQATPGGDGTVLNGPGVASSRAMKPADPTPTIP